MPYPCDTGYDEAVEEDAEDAEAPVTTDVCQALEDIYTDIRDIKNLTRQLENYISTTMCSIQRLKNNI